MKSCTFRCSRPTRLGHLAAIAAVLGICMAGLGHAVAQQPAPPKKAPEKAPDKKAPTKPEAKAPPPAGNEKVSMWVKFCQKAPVQTQGVVGEKEICVTQHEELDVNGRPTIASSVMQAQGADKMQLNFMIPMGVILPPGVGYAVLTTDEAAALWDKMSKNEQIEDDKITYLKAPFIACRGWGCSAEVEATPDVVGKMKTGGAIFVRFVAPTGQAMFRLLPLQGFGDTFAGKPADMAKHQEAIRQALAARQEEIINRDPELAALVKQQQDAQKNLEDLQKRMVSQDPKLAEAIKQMQDVQSKLVEHARSKQAGPPPTGSAPQPAAPAKK